MEILLQDINENILVSSDIFNYAFNQSLIQQVVVSYLSTKRQGTSAQKNRSEVSGSGKKPWKQKGTGRARAGTVQSPIWRSGGVTFASKTRSYKNKINKKMYRNALKSIVSELLRQNRLVFLKNFFINLPKTKLLLKHLKNMNFNKKEKILILIKDDNTNQNLFFASRNLHTVKVNCLNNESINPINLINYDKIILTQSVVKHLEKQLA